MTYKHWHFLSHKSLIVLVDPPSLALTFCPMFCINYSTFVVCMPIRGYH